MSVLEGVEADLALLPERLRGGALAMSARVLAAELDGHNSSTSKSMCAKVLLETMDRLRALAPPERKGSPLDEIKARRDGRLADAKGAKRPSGRAASGRGSGA